MMPKVSFEGKVPKCFRSQEQYRAWKEMARFAYASNWVCTDCTPEYQDSMKAEKRCENPHVQFQTSDDGFVEGVVYLSLFRG